MSDSDCDSGEFNLMAPAFYVEYTGKAVDLNVPPSTGNEYLRRVQIEAKKCPSVVVANIDVEKCSKPLSKQIIPDIVAPPPAPEGLAPSSEWQEYQIACFSDVRQRLAKYKAKQKEFPVIKFPFIEKAQEWKKICCENSSFTPLLSVVCVLKQSVLEQLLEYNTQWLTEAAFTQEQGRWIYAILACLEKPFSPEACSLMRTFARTCAILRSQLTSKDDERLAPYNLFICLVAHYFYQLDLADKA